MALDPEASGVWLKIGRGKDAQRLTVIIHNYDNGVSIQAGVDGRSGSMLYMDLIRKTIYILLASGVCLAVLSIYLVKMGLSPLVNTRNMISGLVRGKNGDLLPADGSGPELDSLHVQINRLVAQNRQLVLEMQQSLDNVAHDLRTPMTRLRSVAEYGLQADGDVERLRESLSDCLEESERVLAMLNIMMSVAEAESGAMHLELREGDLGDSLAQVVTLYEYVAEEKNISLSLGEVVSVVLRVDQTRISQVWANLVDNGIKYGREGGWLKIAARTDNGGVVVTFEDNGMGISENEQRRIWERLYRGDRSRSQQGLGLGLNYVQAVVAAHGGTVAVTSRLHHGSRFEVRLPLSCVVV
jgi:signal transduction histidine kinase